MTRFNRQSFLGPDSESILANSRIGVVGLGGGGSHLVQQLAHIGIRHLVVYDPDCIDPEGSNLNRTVGATEDDVVQETPKIEVARRLFRGLHATGTFVASQRRWQDDPLPLRTCDMVFGCVDGIHERHQLEAECRRYMIPYIDLGMDVHSDAGIPRICGQVVLSMPGDLCLHCLQFVERLSKPKYGDAGGHPQVIWPNGILASTAVGLATELLCHWSATVTGSQYLVYDSRTRTVAEDPRMRYWRSSTCTHYPLAATGALHLPF